MNNGFYFNLPLSYALDKNHLKDLKLINYLNKRLKTCYVLKVAYSQLTQLSFKIITKKFYPLLKAFIRFVLLSLKTLLLKMLIT